ncbi:hypothetical protein BCF55_1383 [Hydrogenivirga caldilitoris]|uniref:LysM domain-containing protein n=1 Tax=Hydrogenivirga caldilitoris TaxID=246264 RepID=A0A497XS57_9AQUI|nr:hypothetical protein [Hydrogenivirga caldilitoris]RLJ71091.1 hypothetical protein BCF55_1383 [Hydrogenivirga caldilitoris]
MRREIIALLPVLGLSAAFVVNQSCATKSALEEVEKEAQEPKENVAQAKNNLKESRNLLSDAKRLLESAKEKLEAHAADKQAHTPPPPPPPPEEVAPAQAEYGEVTVGWCDTLWDISERVYGNTLYWPSIYNLNRDKIGSDPWILAQGWVLKYKTELSEEEKREAVKEAIEWDLRFKNRPKTPKCPPK